MENESFVEIILSSKDVKSRVRELYDERLDKELYCFVPIYIIIDDSSEVIFHDFGVKSFETHQELELLTTEWCQQFKHIQPDLYIEKIWNEKEENKDYITVLFVAHFIKKKILAGIDYVPIINLHLTMPKNFEFIPLTEKLKIF